MDLYPKLHQTLGTNNFEGALDHWFTDGEDKGLNARPRSTTPIKISGPTIVGGGGGGAWTDDAVCQGQYVIGWRVYSGSKLDRLQFL